jgi:hypothetical protein
MSAWGTFISACGFEYHGPKGYLAFSPRLTPEKFKAAFTSAEGWGSIEQTRDGGKQRQAIDVKWGRLRLRELAFDIDAGAAPTSVGLSIRGAITMTRFKLEGRRVRINLEHEIVLNAGDRLDVQIG